MIDDHVAGQRVNEQLLFAVRALAIFFIQSAIASLVGGLIVAVGAAVLLLAGPDGTVLGGVLVVAGAGTTFIWQIVVIARANVELRKSGAVSGGFAQWLGLGR